jgi:hypothetical protein
MHRLSINRAVVWTSALLVIALVAATALAVTTANSQVGAAKTPTVNNGGARLWIAFDPDGRSIGPVQFLSKTVSIVNTSTARNTYTLTYEPAHLVICRGTLAAGASAFCGVQPTQHLSGGYFQARATQPVLLGGHSDVPVIRYVQNSPGGTYGADPSTGEIQNIPLNWQPGCPPKRGSGCPDGSLTNTNGGGNVQR